MKNVSSLPQMGDPTANRPYGQFVDVSAPGLQDGVPARSDWLSDLAYGMIAVMDRVGIVPDNSEEGTVTSQFANAIVENIRRLNTSLDENITVEELLNDRDIFCSPTADRTMDIATNGAERQGIELTIYNNSATYKVTITYFTATTFVILANEYVKFKWSGTRWIIIESNSQEFLGWEECFYSLSRTAEIDGTNHIYELTVTGDKTAYFKAGQKIKFTQDASTKYAVITYVETSGGNTTLTIYGGTDYAISANAITNTRLAKVNRPYDWENDCAKWSIKYDLNNFTQTNFTSGSWYNTNNSFYKEKGKWFLRNNNISTFGTSISTTSQVKVEYSYSTSNSSDVNSEFHHLITGLYYSYGHSDFIKTINGTSRVQLYVIGKATVDSPVSGRSFQFASDQTLNTNQSITLTPCGL